jgi:hypothetical protein
MINEIDYSHRLVGAQIDISAGSHDLKFRSYNKNRLRKLIGHVQHCMADAKRQNQLQQQGQNNHLERLNEQLQLYLLAQQGNERELTRRLMEAHDQKRQIIDATPTVANNQPESYAMQDQLTEAAQAEIFGSRQSTSVTSLPSSNITAHQFDPQRTAYTRIPLSLRHRNFGRAATSASGAIR